MHIYAYVFTMCDFQCQYIKIVLREIAAILKTEVDGLFALVFLSFYIKPWLFLLHKEFGFSPVYLHVTTDDDVESDVFDQLIGLSHPFLHH